MLACKDIICIEILALILPNMDVSIDQYEQISMCFSSECIHSRQLSTEGLMYALLTVSSVYPYLRLISELSGYCCFRWRNTPDAVRSKLMLKIADLLESKLEEFVVAESRDNGKPLSVARMVDIPRAVYNFRFFATSILHDTNA